MSEQTFECPHPKCESKKMDRDEFDKFKEEIYYPNKKEIDTNVQTFVTKRSVWLVLILVFTTTISSIGSAIYFKASAEQKLRTAAEVEKISRNNEKAIIEIRGSVARQEAIAKQMAKTVDKLSETVTNAIENQERDYEKVNEKLNDHLIGHP